uniref:Formyltetrahydrofolate deformylase n=1 Tax=Anthurium amnicola TaxID=1678845 RepID=A0A1D1XT82_9ARAE
MLWLRRAVSASSQSHHPPASRPPRVPGGAVPSRPSSSSSSPPLSAGGGGRMLGIHVFRCPDAVGIVAKLAERIASRGGNIHGVDVFVPENKQIFYSRSEFVFDPANWPREMMDADFFNLSKFFNADKSIVRVPDIDPKFRIAVLASKQDHCLMDLLHGWQDGRLPVHIDCVISNHHRAPNTHVMQLLERHRIPYHYLKTAPGNKREEEILNLVEDTNFLVLARYMQIFSRRFLECYGKDIINIHHGLLPSFKGVKLIGATSHFVTEELDAGPIIEQMVEGVSHRDNLQSFVRKSENLEKQCLAKAIKSYCELRVLPYEVKKTVVF